jgi:hypothetical protein
MNTRTLHHGRAVIRSTAVEETDRVTDYKARQRRDDARAAAARGEWTKAAKLYRKALGGALWSRHERAELEAAARRCEEKAQEAVVRRMVESPT